MDKLQAQSSLKKINMEAFSLTPSSLITLFEIDISNLIFSVRSDVTIFRFHNNINLTNINLFWQDNEYVAFPISAEGFELTSKGVLPTPTLSISAVTEEAIYPLSIFKQKLRDLNYLIGAKVTRRRTFLSNLDQRNFETPPVENFDPDPYAEFPKDIYYIDRKAHEDKYSIQFELSSIFDLQGLQLPNRLIVSRSCPWAYRGHGCNYEYNSRRTDVHGTATLLNSAPPVANDRNESLIDILNIYGVADRGAWQGNTAYKKGDSVYIEKNGIKYYFVAKQDNPEQPPPNGIYWVSDQCDKSLIGCRFRYRNTPLPFGGFPAVNRLQLE